MVIRFLSPGINHIRLGLVPYHNWVPRTNRLALLRLRRHTVPKPPMRMTPLSPLQDLLGMFPVLKDLLMGFLPPVQHIHLLHKMRGMPRITPTPASYLHQTVTPPRPMCLPLRFLPILHPMSSQLPMYHHLVVSPIHV